jgi:hypothetical protein
MATLHEYWDEQSEIYALGALDGQELKDFEAHLASGCTICEASLRETRETLNFLLLQLLNRNKRAAGRE